MDSVQIGQKIHEYIDQADERVLTLIHSLITADKNQDWWDELHPNVQRSIDRALQQSDRGEGRPHEEVINQIKIKYLK
jgi:hypothetical protein